MDAGTTTIFTVQGICKQTELNPIIISLNRSDLKGKKSF